MDRGYINGPMDLARLSWMLMRKGTARILLGLREATFGLVDLGHGLRIRKGAARILRGLQDVTFGIIDLGYGILLPMLIVGTLYASVVSHFLKNDPTLEAVAAIIVGILIAPLPVVVFALFLGPIIWMAAKTTKWWRSRSREINTRDGLPPAPRR